MNEFLNNIEINTDSPDLPRVYWPSKRGPGVRIAAYAMACVETVVKSSDKARGIYDKIIQCWDLPGCQSMISESTKYEEDCGTWLSSLDKAVAGEELLIDLPNEWAQVFMKIEGNIDFLKLLKYAYDFTLVGFNREVDLKNNKPKVLPERAPNLGLAIATLSLMDYLAENPEVKGPAALSINSSVDFLKFCQRISARPSTRKERSYKHGVVQKLRQEGYTLTHFEKMADDAEKWYKCRVDPGTIEEYLEELFLQGVRLERSNIENDIAPCDEATGYPREWRK